MSQLYNECKKYNTENEIKNTSPAQSDINKKIENPMFAETKINNEIGKDYYKSKSNKDVNVFCENNKANNEKLKNKNICKNMINGNNNNNMPKIKKKSNKNSSSNSGANSENKKPRTQCKRKLIANANRKINNINGNNINKNNFTNVKLSQNKNNNKEGRFPGL